MNKLLEKIVQPTEYAGALAMVWTVRRLPYGCISPLARCAAFAMRAAFPFNKLIEANVRAAMPELSKREVKRIRRESYYHMVRNLLEFVWINNDPDRIRRCYYPPQSVVDLVMGHIRRGERVIFITPHLGSWEASGLMVPFYGNFDMAAIAKPVHNPYLNKLLNSGGREKQKGLHIIFSRGAARTAVKLLKQGMSIGTLIDQNTRVRDGGRFLDFFGLPVASSVSPAVLKRYCDARGIPAVVLFGASLRMPDGRIQGFCEELPKPFDAYPDDRAVIQEVMGLSEKYIRAYPEQYLWLYKRFQHIPPDCPEELRKRYPYYARVPKQSFFMAGKHRRDFAE